MNSDFRLSVGIFEHVKMKKLNKKLGKEGGFALIQLFHYCAVNKPTGCLEGMDNDDIIIAADYTGTGDFIATLLELKWIEKDDLGTYFIHDWKVHNPWAAGAEARSEAARSAVNSRWSKTTPEERSEYARKIVKARYSANSNDSAYEMHTDSMQPTYGLHTDLHTPTYDPTYGLHTDLHTPTYDPTYSFPILSDSDSYPTPNPNPIPNPDSILGVTKVTKNTKNEDLPGGDNNKTETKKRFAPPTPEQAESYFVELGLPGQGQAFFDHHTAKGWFLSKGQKMVDWRAACRTWRHFYLERHPQPPTTGQSSLAQSAERHAAHLRSIIAARGVK